MAQPQVPGDGGETLALPCGESRSTRSLDLGMREFACGCGDRHAVVMDVHPPERFVPDFLVEVLREAIETTSEEMPEFGTAHLLGIVWVSDFDARRLHEIVVELVVELMEHAVSHADDDAAVSEFERRMLEFDVSEFVEAYRAERDLSEDDVYV